MTHRSDVTLIAWMWGILLVALTCLYIAQPEHPMEIPSAPPRNSPEVSWDAPSELFLPLNQLTREGWIAAGVDV